jgi:hypothetical protein
MVGSLKSHPYLQIISERKGIYDLNIYNFKKEYKTLLVINSDFLKIRFINQYTQLHISALGNTGFGSLHSIDEVCYLIIVGFKLYVENEDCSTFIL